MNYESAAAYVSRQALLEECHAHFQSYCHGHLGATDNTQMNVFHLMGMHHILRDRCAARGPVGAPYHLLSPAQVGSHHSLRRRGVPFVVPQMLMNDGVAAGTWNAVARVIAIIKEHGEQV